MSEQRVPGGVPSITLGWRLKMALEHGGVSVQEMADELGMSRGQLSRYLNDKGTPPRRGLLLAWAIRCAVDRDWLLYGAAPQDSGDPSGLGIPSSTCSVLRFRLAS